MYAVSEIAKFFLTISQKRKPFFSMKPTAKYAEPYYTPCYFKKTIKLKNLEELIFLSDSWHLILHKKQLLNDIEINIFFNKKLNKAEVCIDYLRTKFKNHMGCKILATHFKNTQSQRDLDFGILEISRKKSFTVSIG